MDFVALRAFHEELAKLAGVSATSRVKEASIGKSALLERLVRLGATDVPGTPRLLMKKRTPAELAALQQGVEQGWNKRVTTPLMRVADRGLSKLPEGKVRNLATAGAKAVAQDPAGTLLTQAIPVPGAAPAWMAAKRGLERVIDRVSPLQG